jgi:hypothetical protein
VLAEAECAYATSDDRSMTWLQTSCAGAAAAPAPERRLPSLTCSGHPVQASLDGARRVSGMLRPLRRDLAQSVRDRAAPGWAGGRIERVGFVVPLGCRGDHFIGGDCTSVGLYLSAASRMESRKAFQCTSRSFVGGRLNWPAALVSGTGQPWARRQEWHRRPARKGVRSASGM